MGSISNIKNSNDSTQSYKKISIWFYKLKKRNANGKPKSNKDIPNSGEVNNIAGTSPIKALTNAVKTNDVIISLIFIGAMNKFVKFLLHISSKNKILKPILVLNKKS